MKNLEQIVKDYQEKIANILYAETIELLEFLNDEEFEQLINNHRNLFIKCQAINKNNLGSNVETLKEACDIILEYLMSKNLTEDEFNAMTIDDVKEYINSLIVNKDHNLYKMIKVLENA